jgi:plastocyanin
LYESKKIRLFIAIYVLSVAIATGLLYQQYSFGQTNETSSSASEQMFRSGFDTFVASEPEGYGTYNEKESNVFAPGETFLLYVEPVGYSYGNVTDENGDQLYTMNFTADFTISNPNGTILAGQEDLPLSNLVSHHQNKELILQMSVDQTSPFPPGDYILRYTFTDENSGKSFDIRKDVTVRHEEEGSGGGNNNNIQASSGTVAATTPNSTLGKNTNANKVSMVSTGDEGYSYQPNTIQVKVGDTVTWTNTDDALHTVTSGSGTDENMGAEFDSGMMATGKTFEHTFSAAGEYPYFCVIHPDMVGKVTVS